MGKLSKAVQDEGAEKPFDIPPEHKKKSDGTNFLSFLLSWVFAAKPETYLEPSRTSTMKLFAEIVNGLVKTKKVRHPKNDDYKKTCSKSIIKAPKQDACLAIFFYI